MAESSEVEAVPQPNPAAEGSELFTCPICLDHCPRSEVFVPSGCAHEFCRDCARGVVLSAVRCQDVTGEKCVSRYIPKKPKKKKGHRRGGTKGCLSMGSMGDLIKGTMKQFRSLDMTEDSEASLNKYLKRNRVLECPQCKNGITKMDGGCNHIMCAVCKTHICWLCGVKICQGINNYWDANRHFWIKGTPCYGQIQAVVRDHVKKSSGKPPRWRRMLGYHFMARTPRDPAAVMLQVELEAVRPDGAAKAEEEEYRLSVALLPLRLRIDQNMVAFLQGFFASPGPDRGNDESTSREDGTSNASTVQEVEGATPFLQKVEIQAFSIVIDYQPRRLDAAALRSGSFVEVLNLVPWGGVQLDLPRVKASGLQGWAALGNAVGNAYLQDIASTQVHKFVVGVAPVRSLCRVGWAAKQLLSIPADQLRNTGNSNSNSDVAFTRQLRRGVTTLARAVTLEALGLGASVAGGADFVLRGGSGSGSEHPAGLKEGLKQAAQGLSSGLETAASALVYSPVRSVKEGEGVGTAVVRAIRAAPGAIAAPASAAAAATRVTLLGMRNALDPERYEERRR